MLVKSVTDLEIDEAIRDAWRIVLGGSASTSPSVRRLAAALLAVTAGTQAHPHWVTPDDLWRDQLAVLADQGAWLVSWGPRPGGVGLPGTPCSAAGKPNAAQEYLCLVTLDGAGQHRGRRREQNRTKAANTSPG
jgi:hypothetical protein